MAGASLAFIVAKKSNERLTVVQPSRQGIFAFGVQEQPKPIGSEGENDRGSKTKYFDNVVLQNLTKNILHSVHAWRSREGRCLYVNTTICPIPDHVEPVQLLTIDTTICPTSDHVGPCGRTIIVSSKHLPAAAD